MNIIANYGDSTIYINGNPLHLPAPFGEGLLIGDIYIVLLDVNSSDAKTFSFDIRANIFAFNSKGEEIWQVQENDFKRIKRGYDRIFFVSNTIFNALLLGVLYDIDIKNGKLLRSFDDGQQLTLIKEYSGENTEKDKTSFVFRIYKKIKQLF